jgi:8-oxo-dGTP pyrophosphatase MutT (NUDIX family)
MTEISIARSERVELVVSPRPWPFAELRRAEIDRHFDAFKQVKPSLWNGRMLMMHRYSYDGTALRGGCFETDYASFIAWRDWDFPDQSVQICFGMGALRGCDGAFLLGVMGRQTANAGRIYFPAGMLDPADIVDGTVDIAGNVLREVAEETGLVPGDYEAQPGWHTVFAGPRIAQIKVLRAPETAAALRARILAHLARTREPELADVRIVAGPSDLDPMMCLTSQHFLIISGVAPDKSCPAACQPGRGRGAVACACVGLGSSARTRPDPHQVNAALTLFRDLVGP